MIAKKAKKKLVKKKLAVSKKKVNPKKKATKNKNSSRQKEVKTMRDRKLTTKEAADMLCLSPQTLTNWRTTKAKNLPYIKIGNRVFYYESMVLDFERRCQIR